MERSFSQNKDVDREILGKLDDRDLFQTVLTSKYAYEITNNDNFWRNRLLKRYESTIPYKAENMSWKRYYLSVIYYIGKLREEAKFEYSQGDPKYLYKLLVLQKLDRLISHRVDELFSKGYFDAALFLHNDVRKQFYLRPHTLEEFSSLQNEYLSKN